MGCQLPCSNILQMPVTAIHASAVRSATIWSDHSYFNSIFIKNNQAIKKIQSGAAINAYFYSTRFVFILLDELQIYYINKKQEIITENQACKTLRPSGYLIIRERINQMIRISIKMKLGLP